MFTPRDGSDLTFFPIRTFNPSIRSCWNINALRKTVEAIAHRLALLCAVKLQRIGSGPFADNVFVRGFKTYLKPLPFFHSPTADLKQSGCKSRNAHEGHDSRRNQQRLKNFSCFLHRDNLLHSNVIKAAGSLQFFLVRLVQSIQKIERVHRSPSFSR